MNNFVAAITKLYEADCNNRMDERLAAAVLRTKNLCAGQ